MRRALDAHFANLLRNRLGIITAFGPKLRLLAVLDELIRNAQANYLRAVVIIGHEFKYSASHTAFETAVFNSDHFAEFLEYFVQQRLVHADHNEPGKNLLHLKRQSP